MFEGQVQGAKQSAEKAVKGVKDGAQGAWGFAKRHKRELLVATGVGGVCAAVIAGALGTSKAALAVGAILATDVVIGVTTAVIVAKQREAQSKPHIPTADEALGHAA